MTDDQGAEVVIVGKDGTEHVFPSGFDPQKAAAIVRGGATGAPVFGAPSTPTAEDMLTHRVGAETNPAGTSPDWTTPLNEAMQGPAHPTSWGDIAQVLAAPADATRSVAMGILRRIPSVLKATAQNTQPGLASKLSFVPRAIGEFNETLPSTMAQRVREFKGTSTAAPAVAPAPAAPSVPDVVDRALMRGRLQMTSPEPSVTPATAPAEDAATAFNARYFRNPAQQQQVLGQIKGRVQMAPSHDVSPLREPRVQIGAEQVGRQAGLTKESVREVTGPILDEAHGEASPILPQDALNRIIDDMKTLAPGAEREAYVARATSGKAKWQVENLRRTLEHLGLTVPPIALAVREAVAQRLMPSHATEGR